jgi:hypothetical protein
VSGGKTDLYSSPDVQPVVDYKDYRWAASNWKHLIKFQVPITIQNELQKRNMKVQTFESAAGPDINLDYYGIIIKQFPTVNNIQLDAKNLLKTIRLGMTGKSPLFIDPNKSTFLPLESVDDAKWNSSDPTGAVVFIDTPYPKDAAVVVSKATDEFWIFSTITIPTNSGTQVHPVSGHRLWRIDENPTGDFTLLIQGADRSSRFAESQVPVREKITFSIAHELWVDHQQCIVSWINKMGGVAKAQEPISDRYKWYAIQGQIYGKSREL